MFNLKSAILRLYPAIMSMAIVIIAFLTFISGVGRYRVIVATIIFFIVNIYFQLKRYNTKSIDILYVPLLVISIYLDYKYGQIYPIYTVSDPVLSLLLLIILEMLMSNIIKSKIEIYSNYSVFALCPKCKYEMKKLGVKCINCNFEGIKSENDMNILSSNQIMSSHNLDQLIEMDKDENIIRQIKLGRYTGKSVFKNNHRLLLTNMIITNNKIVFLKYKTFGRGWEYKEIIYLSDISRINYTYKFHINRKIPIIELILNDNTNFQMYFTYIIHEYEKLNEIANTIINLNNNLQITYID